MRRIELPEAVRAAEAPLLARDGDEPVMRRAATGMAVACARLLRASCGTVTGSRVTLLVGAGNNGGDALWAGAWLAARGSRVTAVALAPVLHVGGEHALCRAGGRVVDAVAGLEAVREADLVIDGIVGIGGRGALRPEAALLARAATAAGAIVVACDLPSGVDPATGAVPDAEAVVRADVTVTFGALKPALVLEPAAELAGVVHLVDIGLGPFLAEEPAAYLAQADDVALSLPRALPDDHKYSRGVVRVDAGSRDYPGAGVLVTGAARHGGAGYVQYAGGAHEQVIAAFPDVVVSDREDGRVTARVAGPGLAGPPPPPTAHGLDHDAPVLIDATALRWLAESEQWQRAVADRASRGVVTVLTPHDGEFAGLMPEIDLAAGRLEAAQAAAERFGAVVLLKGATTVVAAPGVTPWINAGAPPALATAGTGDVLAGLGGAWLAAESARARQDGRALDSAAAVRVMVCAAWLHALAGRLAGAGGRPVAALDVLTALPDAVVRARAGEEP